MNFWTFKNLKHVPKDLLLKKDLSILTEKYFSGPPAVIEVDIMVRSMGPISEVDMVRNH